MYSNPVTPALELLTKRMEAGELKPRQFEMVARELMRTAIFAYLTRPMPEADALSVKERNLWMYRFEASALLPTQLRQGFITVR